VEFCVTLHWTDIAVLLAVVLAGCALTYVVLQRLIRRSISNEQAQIQKKLIALTGTLHSLEACVAEMRDSAAEAVPALETEAGQADLATETRIESDSEQVAAEILATITAATAAFLGRPAHIRSVTPLSAQQAVSPWSQQGRVFVQASHNLRPKR
jgi:hypothetical protein